VGPSRQWYRPSFRAISLTLPFLNSFLASCLRPCASLDGLFSSFHPRFRSLFVRRRIMVFRSIVLCWPGRRRQIELKICDLVVCKVVRLPRDSRHHSLVLRRRNPLLLICYRCRLKQSFLLAAAVK